MANTEKLSVSLDDLEVVEVVEIRNSEVVRRIKELKEQGLEGPYVQIGWESVA